MAAFPKLRQSMLAAFDNCNLLSKFDNQFSTGWSHPWQARGQLFHRFAGRALREMYRQQETTIEIDVAKAILFEVLRQADVDKECPLCASSRIRRGVTKDGMRYCLACKQRFETGIVNVPMSEVKDLLWMVIKWAQDNRFSIEHLVDVEQRLEADITYSNPHGGFVYRTLTGQLDALFLDPDDDTHAIVPDWKTSWAIPGPADVSFEGYFQQRFYGWLVMRNYKRIERVTLREFYVRFSEPREATIWRQTVDDIEHELAALVERFDCVNEGGLHRPSPGKWCSMCPTPHKCPITPAARGQGRIGDAEEAEQVAAELVVGNQIVRRNSDALKAWAQRHGPVPVRDAKGQRVYGYRETTRTTAPKIEEIELAERMKGSPLTAAEIKTLYRTTRGTRFEAYSPPRDQLVADDEALIQALQLSLSSGEGRE